MCTQLTKALIIFAKRPVAGKVKTRLTPLLLPEEAAELYSCMLGDTLAKAARLDDLDKFLFYEEDALAAAYFSRIAGGMTCLPQQGRDLGERMAAALSRLFAEGYGVVAVIGTDSPDLPQEFVRDAFRLLSSGEADAVFGPSEDGGYYLLAMKRLHDGLFRGIPWSSGVVLQKSLGLATAAGVRVALLPVWHDVDSATDLHRPELFDEGNGASLTREFLDNWLLHHVMQEDEKH
jgi:rSAM/selenodomain-associated transferase 1